MWKYIGVSQMPHTPHTKSPINFYIDSTSPELHTSYTDSTSDIYIGMSKMPHTPYTNSTNFFFTEGTSIELHTSYTDFLML